MDVVKLGEWLKLTECHVVEWTACTSKVAKGGNGGGKGGTLYVERLHA